MTFSIKRDGCPTVPNVPPVPNGTGDNQDIKNLVNRILEREAERNKQIAVPLSHIHARGTGGTLGTGGTVLSDDERLNIISLMVEWNERAAMMTCSSYFVEEADIAAWNDLRLDEVFFGKRLLH
jgi:hypothetical protein